MFNIPKRNLRQYLNILPVCVISFSLGTGLGWIAPAFVYFQDKKGTFAVSTTEISWISSTYFAVEIISPIFAGICLKIFGRKPTLVLGAAFITISWIIILFSKSAIMIITSRAVLGTAAGFIDVTWGTYVAEFATPDKRAVLGSIIIISMNAGIVFEYVLNLFVSYELLAVIPLIISLHGFIFSFFMAESPYSLIAKNKEFKALLNLIWVRGVDNKEVRDEFEEIKQYIEEEKTSGRSVKHFFQSPAEYNVYIICVLIFASVMFSGYMTITHYIGYVMDKYKALPCENDLILIYGLVQFIFVVNMSPFLIGRIKRKTMLLIGFTLCSLVNLLLAILFYVDTAYPDFSIKCIPEIIFILFVVIGILYVGCLQPSAYILKSEMFPPKLKIAGSVAATVCNAVVQFMIMKAFMTLWKSCGIFVNFSLYFGFCFVMIFVVYKLLPETKGKSLAEIQKIITESIPNQKEKQAQTSDVTL